VILLLPVQFQILYTGSTGIGELRGSQGHQGVLKALKGDCIASMPRKELLLPCSWLVDRYRFWLEIMGLEYVDEQSCSHLSPSSSLVKISTSHTMSVQLICNDWSEIIATLALLGEHVTLAVRHL
jgi:hypothetical protein